VHSPNLSFDDRSRRSMLRSRYHAAFAYIYVRSKSLCLPFSAVLLSVISISISILMSMSSNASANPLTLYYESRVPFMNVQNGELAGSEGQPAADAFKAAGISYTLSEAPVARQVALVGGNLEPSCAVGLYWTAERAKLGKYTLPIFRSLAQDIVTRGDNPKMQSLNSMAALLADPALRLVLRNGYSYGASLDALLQTANAHILRPSEDSHGRIKLVLEGMADATLFTAEEANYQIKQFGADGKPLVVRHFSDSPMGEPRHLYCSKSVDDAIIKKLNDVLSKRP
jgi:polar amino acid transport system substrate-binding protein